MYLSGSAPSCVPRGRERGPMEGEGVGRGDDHMACRGRMRAGVSVVPLLGRFVCLGVDGMLASWLAGLPT